jgi:hypothetical protein
MQNEAVMAFAQHPTSIFLEWLRKNKKSRWLVCGIQPEPGTSWSEWEKPKNQDGWSVGYDLNLEPPILQRRRTIHSTTIFSQEQQCCYQTLQDHNWTLLKTPVICWHRKGEKTFLEIHFFHKFPTFILWGGGGGSVTDQQQPHKMVSLGSAPLVRNTFKCNAENWPLTISGNANKQWFTSYMVN